MLKNELKKQGDILFRYRGTIPLIILFFGLIVFISGRLNVTGEFGFLQSPGYLALCFGVAWIGQIIRILTVGYTPANTSGRNKYYQIADEINTTGIYSTVRHPLYLGNFFMWLGMAMITGNLWFIALFMTLYWIYYERIMYSEEMFMFGKFGEKYSMWAEKTPAFIPAFKNFVKPKLPFSWVKILKKEKNGINAIFLLFFIFNFTSNCVDARRFVLELNFWFYAAATSFIIYLVLKFLKRKTTVLDEKGR